MKRRYKLLLIIVIGCILTFCINERSDEKKINLVAIGDGVALGMTPYNVVGTSYNDYLKDYFENKNKLNNYNNEFCESHFTISELNNILEKNLMGSKSDIPIKQTIANADILTIAFGQDELTDYTMHSIIDDKVIEKFIFNYSNLLKTIRTFYDKEIILISLYPAYKFDKNAVISINQNLSKLAVNNKAKYYDLFSLSLNSNYYLQTTSYYMSYKAHQIIASDLIKLLSV